MELELIDGAGNSLVAEPFGHEVILTVTSGGYANPKHTATLLTRENIPALIDFLKSVY